MAGNPPAHTITAARDAGPQPGRKLPLSVALGMVFGLLMVVAIGTVLGLSLYSNYRNTVDFLASRSVTTIGLLEDALERNLRPASDIVEFLAVLYGDNVFELDEREKALALLRGASAGDPNIGAVIIYRTDVNDRFGVYRNPNNEYGEIENDAITNPMIQRELMDGAPPGESVWGRPVIVNGRLFANVRHALVRNGDIDGFVVAAIPIRGVSDRLSAASGLDGATVFVIDADNRILVHPKLDHAAALRDGKREATGEAALNLLAPKLALFEDEVLRRFDERQPPPNLFRGKGLADIDVKVLDSDGRDSAAAKGYLFLTRQTNAYSARPWTIGLYYPSHAVNTEIRRLMLSLVSSVALLVIAVITAALLGRQIARPVKRVTAVADKVAELDLEDIEPLPESRIREFDAGARTLNKMVDALSAFATYVPKALVAKLIRLGAEETGRPAEMDLTIMFTDIAGFTTRSETMGAADTADFLNAHFRALGTEIDACGGTIDKYMGDGLLAFWGAPEPVPDHPLRACEAALRIAAAVKRQNEALPANGKDRIQVRIGIHTGRTIVGNIGAESRVNYTVVGDTVNSCARLQELGKGLDPEADAIILISEQTYAAVRQTIPAVDIGSHVLRGREQETGVYRILLRPV